ncbi:hypothetical protein WN51_10334 [Melipona quadrifasciata]|uniref:Uncharacterized protein n=1 Tax=Melipona quadrifasciata TaxID=166423 RepID=A0A0M9A8B3_9HYME|nr:hypothetical protein WN51_10334 [Melipona quadrifasciata]
MSSQRNVENCFVCILISFRHGPLLLVQIIENREKRNYCYAIQATGNRFLQCLYNGMKI